MGLKTSGTNFTHDGNNLADVATAALPAFRNKNRRIVFEQYNSIKSRLQTFCINNVEVVK